MNTTLYEKIKEILVDALDIKPEEIKPESDLINDLGINSLELADLVFRCEDEFDIEIDEKATRKFATVKDVVDYLEGIVK